MAKYPRQKGDSGGRFGNRWAKKKKWSSHHQSLRIFQHGSIVTGRDKVYLTLK